MTAHTHTSIVPGCYRCELGQDEERSAIINERDEACDLLERIYAQAVLNRGYVTSALLNEIDGMGYGA